MLDRIAGQDRDGAAGLKPEIEQALRQRIDRALGLAIGQFAPLPFGASALREPDAIGRSARPFRQGSRNMGLIGLQRNPRLQDDDAVGPPLDRDIACQPFDLAKGRLRRTATAFPAISRLPEIGPLRIFSLVSIYSYRLRWPAFTIIVVGRAADVLRPLPLWERASLTSNSLLPGEGYRLERPLTPSAFG